MTEVRLIDVNALREEILKTVNVNDIGRGEFWEGLAQELQWCVDIIDNAPTVEPEVYMTAEDYNLYLEGYKQGRKDFEKPQGEWADYDNTFYKCPNCGYLLEKCCPQCQNKVILPKGGAE